MRLYIDFDGVILDTVSLYMDIINQAKAFTEDDRRAIFKDLDWDIIIEEADEINNSIENIRKIISSNKYEVSILTHVNSENEYKAKESFMQKNGIDIPVIPVYRPNPKVSKVDPNQAILVDDTIENLILWEEQGGIGVYFSNNEKNYPIKNITSLEEILDF